MSMRCRGMIHCPALVLAPWVETLDGQGCIRQGRLRCGNTQLLVSVLKRFYSVLGGEWRWSGLACAVVGRRVECHARPAAHVMSSILSAWERKRRSQVARRRSPWGVRAKAPRLGQAFGSSFEPVPIRSSAGSLGLDGRREEEDGVRGKKSELTTQQTKVG